MKDLTPQDVLNHGNFFQDTLLRASSFVSYCKDRCITVSEERLERLEKLGIFSPVLRIKYPEIKIKQKIIKTKGQPDKVEEFGILEEGENWKGKLRKDYSGFIYFDTEYVKSWIEQGYIYVPQKGGFRAWSKYKDRYGYYKVDTFYSIFQVYSIKSVIQRLTMTTKLEILPERTEKEAIKTHRRWKKYFRDYILNAPENRKDKYWVLCHFLSRRYLPESESDGLLISVPAKEFTKFDFFAYRRAWNAQDFLNYIELSVEDVKGAWEWLARDAEWDNPLSQWNELVNLVNKDMRKRLKNEALFAESLRTMAKMVNLFYEELTGEKLYLSGDSPQDIEIFRGKGIAKDDLLYKEFVANEFGVNPRPKLILMVEGDGEFNEIPKFIKWAFGKSLAMYGIKILNLHSVGEISSKKMVRFIDHFHDLQTLVYFLLDNEGNAVQMQKKLSKMPSSYLKNFTVTKKDLFTIWEKNIEFDNFSDAEIAKAMSTVSENRYAFTEAEIMYCRSEFGKRRDLLSTLYEERLSYGLNKPKLLKFLFQYFEASFEVTVDGAKKKRPLIKVIDDIRHLALRNYQPSSLDVWTDNQHSNWLRTRIQKK